MYLLKKDNVRKIVKTEAKRDALIALGYTVVPSVDGTAVEEVKKKPGKPPGKKPPKKTGTE